MSTFANLVDQISMALSGYVYDQAEQTYLTTAIDADDLTIQVDEPKLISRGIIEIGDEQVWVKSVDYQTGSAVISPFGRGYQGAAAVPHAIGTRVTDNPLFPRTQIKITINQVIQDMYPQMYVLDQHTFPFVAARSTYELPADTRQVAQATWHTIGPSRWWTPIKRYMFNPRAETTAFPTGKSIDIWSAIVPGRTIKVDIIKRPSALVNPEDEFSVTGLDPYVEQVVVYGACYKMAGWLDTPRLQTRAVETSQRSSYVETGAALDVSKYFYALYQQQLDIARARFLSENPSVLHFTEL